MKLTHALIAAFALVVVVVAAGCGGGSAAPGVANVGTSASSAGSSSSSSSDGTGKAGKAASFSACMRSHGVHNFPDPTSGGGISISPGTGIDPNSSTFQAAQRACQKLLDIKPPSAAQQAAMQQQALRFSACMRSHGVPKFPDPQFGSSGMRLTINSKNGIDPNSPVFKAAQQACQHLLPGKNGGSNGTFHTSGTNGK